MRDRLIELLEGKSIDTKADVEHIADYLLANGVIVPPCKVGDTVYVINDDEVEETTVFSIKIESTDSHWTTFVKANIADHGIKFKDGYGRMFMIFIFGKNMFLTREEAEAKLKEGVGE
jgi:hypothetical protein